MKNHTICLWLKAAIFLLLTTSIFFAIGIYVKWNDYVRAERAYHTLQEKAQQNTNQLQETCYAIPDKSRVSEKDFTELKKINAEIVGWLTCEGTAIDYPVMHTDNNDFYLKHLYDKEENPSGSLFSDYRNSGLFTDQNTVIYGHNMKDGTMFRSLNSYKMQEYYEEHPVLILYTPNGDYLIELLSGTLEDGNNEFVRLSFESNHDFLEYINDLQSRSTFKSAVKVNPDDSIVSLCTCSYERDNARYQVVGRLTPLFGNTLSE